MKKHTIKIGKKEFTLVFTLGTLQAMEEMIIDFDLSNIDSIMRSTGGMLDILYCLAEQGAILEEKPLVENRAWFGSHAPANRDWVVNAHKTIVDTLVDGMSMENEDEDEGEVDVVLEDIKKKDGKTD